MQTQADTVISSGISGGEQALAYSAVKIEESWSVPDWQFSALFDGRSQFDNGIGDANIVAEWHAESSLTPLTELELDADYSFERERTEAIKQYHTIGGDIGILHNFETFKAKADVGVEVRLHDNTTQKGFPPLDRAHEDLIDSEAALRLTMAGSAIARPFVEAAWVQRDYLISPERDFSGPELITGFTIASENLKGDVGLLFALRNGKHLFGPSIDLTWTLSKETELVFGLGSGIDQDTSGQPDLFGYYASRIELSKKLSDDLKLSLTTDAILEKRRSGNETEIRPTLKLAWAGKTGPGLTGSIGIVYEKLGSDPSTLDPTFDLALQWRW